VSIFHTGTESCQRNAQFIIIMLKYNCLIERVENHTESNLFSYSQLNHEGSPRAGSKAIYPTACGLGGHEAAIQSINGGTKEDVSLGEPTPGTSPFTIKQSVVGAKIVLRLRERGCGLFILLTLLGARSTSQGMQPCSPSPT
jgi:hypothetical protein